MYNLLLVLQYRGVSIFIPFISSHVDSVAFYVSCNMDRKMITRHSSTSASRVANHRGLELISRIQPHVSALMSQWIPLTKLSDEASVAIKCMPLFELIYLSISKYNAT